MSHRWHNKISNYAQLGGIETSVIDNGPGRGTRIAWINTGTGLRYKVVIDRAMDIAEAFFNQHSLAWLSHTGTVAPAPLTNKGIDWLKTFGGGLITTCGLDHAGGPETDEHGERGLHGPFSNTPAEIESVIQPNLLADRLDMSITGIIRQTVIFGPSFELKRTISGKLGEPWLLINDEVSNCGNAPVPHMLLYHCNFGWPLVDEKTEIIWKGKWQPRPGNANKIFSHENDFRSCPAPLDDHSGSGEEAAFIDVEADDSGNCVCGLYNAQIGILVILRFEKSQLPWLTNWQHWGQGEYVTGLEPGTNPPIGQSAARKENQLIELAPGEKRKYALKIEVISDQKQINLFRESNESN